MGKSVRERARKWGSDVGIMSTKGRESAQDSPNGSAAGSRRLSEDYSHRRHFASSRQIGLRRCAAAAP